PHRLIAVDRYQRQARQRRTVNDRRRVFRDDPGFFERLKADIVGSHGIGTDRGDPSSSETPLLQDGHRDDEEQNDYLAAIVNSGFSHSFMSQSLSSISG